ncbi:MAG: ester cyclase [Deinococcales bacterium]
MAKSKNEEAINLLEGNEKVNQALIDFKSKGDAQNFLQRPGEKTQELAGFEAHYVDFVDYIIRITHRIWEEGDMGYIYDSYQHNCTLHTAYGLSHGIEEVISGSIAFLAGFPDRRLMAEDVIWCPFDRGFLSSHLIYNSASNLGYSAWGPPTGRRVRFMAIADCAAANNRIYEEWLVRDTGAIIRQLGLNIFEVAKGVATGFKREYVQGESERLRGQLPPEAFEIKNAEDPLDVARAIYQNIWNRRHFNQLKDFYQPSVEVHLPNDATIYSLKDYQAYILGLIGMFPDFSLSLENLHANPDPQGGYRIAVRWRFRGNHRHNGWYGPPSGKRVNVLGITHLHLRDGKIWKEYMVFDELALIAQLI